MSSSDIAIKVKNISKLYRIGIKEKIHDSFGRTVFDFIRSPLTNYRRYRSLYRFDDINLDSNSNSSDIIWALRDVSFEVKRGEALGIIGKNGAGKSTLLKILSKITHPTNGRAEFKGKISSLLEVGTGFHQELTGKENVYLNGTILGMKKKEVDSKFDEIVNFSGVEKFIDTPVKRYSSGMKVRLAFSVAAHLEPEILIIDEVLAVGDVEFQNKCLNKMQNLSGHGRTVLFVSHNLPAIQSLCTRAILLRHGQLVYDSLPDEVVMNYLSDLMESSKNVFQDNPERSGSGEIQFIDARIFDESNKSTFSLIAGKPSSFELRYKAISGNRPAHIAMTIYNQYGAAVSNFNTSITNFIPRTNGNEGVVMCYIPELPLPLGTYRVAIAISNKEKMTDHLPNALVFDVVSSTFFKTGLTPNLRYASCLIKHEWRQVENRI